MRLGASRVFDDFIVGGSCLHVGGHFVTCLATASGAGGGNAPRDGLSYLDFARAGVFFSGTPITPSVRPLTQPLRHDTPRVVARPRRTRQNFTPCGWRAPCVTLHRRESREGSVAHRWRLVSWYLGVVVSSTVGAQPDAYADAAGGALGRVHFLTSCNDTAQPRFDRAMALLHSFEFARSLHGFRATLAADSTCAMAEWGIALGAWGNPMGSAAKSPDAIARGNSAVARARAIAPPTERERAYVAAVAQLFENAVSVPQSVRVAAYRDAMGALAARYPDDREAAIFHALSLVAAASPQDKTYADQLRAGATLERLFALEPDHPGLAHYIIHAYDVPALAPRSVVAAARYSRIAPDAPHALHMPSHAWTRVGQWQRSIDANIASAHSARRDGSTAEELHASDYLVYAYLQSGQDTAARRVLQQLPETESRFDPSAVGSAASGAGGIFALAAIPARFALERGDWIAAARLVPRATRVPWADALTHLARALGAAHVGDTATAEAARDALRALQQQLVGAGEAYWAEQLRIQALDASAWLAFARGQRAAALDTMRLAADAEDRTEKSAVTPGPLAPSRELLGEMLLASGDPVQALAAFEATLAREPRRFRAIAGAARAARAAGNAQQARRFASDLRDVCARGDRPGRPDLVLARRDGLK